MNIADTTILRWFKDAWTAYSHLGVNSDRSNPESRRIILNNKVAAVVFILGVWVSLYLVSSSSSSLILYWFAFLLMCVWVMPFLNALGHTYISRHMLSSLMPLFIIGIVAHTRVATPDEVHGASFYVPRFYLMAISFFPLLLFSHNEEWRMYVSLAINGLTLLFFNELLDFFGAGMGILEPHVDDAFFISVSSVICLTVVGSGFYFLNRLNSDYEVRIEELLDETATKNQRIESAISYASNIQKVVLPLSETLNELSDRMFVIYRPLDVVSGDFYYLKKTTDHITFGVIDCTGHGVPGAFVSLLAHGALQRAVEACGAENPGSVMASLNRYFHDDLTRSGNPDISDGLEIILCSLDLVTNELRLAGANLSCHVVQQGTMSEYRCDRGYIRQGNPNRAFTEMNVSLKTGGMVYITTDGISDQFGGKDDKRLGKRILSEHMKTIVELPLDQQRSRITSFFDTWKGDRNQVDDICLVALRV